MDREETQVPKKEEHATIIAVMASSSRPNRSAGYVTQQPGKGNRWAIRARARGLTCWWGHSALLPNPADFSRRWRSGPGGCCHGTQPSANSFNSRKSELGAAVK